MTNSLSNAFPGAQLLNKMSGPREVPLTPRRPFTASPSRRKRHAWETYPGSIEKQVCSLFSRVQRLEADACQVQQSKTPSLPPIRWPWHSRLRALGVVRGVPGGPGMGAVCGAHPRSLSRSGWQLRAWQLPLGHAQGTVTQRLVQSHAHLPGKDTFDRRMGGPGGRQSDYHIRKIATRLVRRTSSSHFIQHSLTEEGVR